MAAYSSSNHLLFRGHSLVWHHAIPDWFHSVINRSNAQKRLQEHVSSVVARYRGRTHSWDVVNEALHMGPGRPDGLDERNPWLDLLGPDYIDLAFRAAREADPHCLLVLNQDNTEYQTSWFEGVRSNFLRLLESLLRKGTPIQAVGIQSHLAVDKYPFDGRRFREFLRSISGMGLKILLTEMDVAEDALRSSDLATRDKKIADEYSRYLSVALDETAVTAVINWGLTDNESWLMQKSPRRDGAAVRPLPFDDHLNPTPAEAAIETAFRNAPARNR